MLIFLVWMEISCIAEIPHGMEHPERTLQVVVNFGNDKSQVHRDTHAHRGRSCPLASWLFHSRKEVVAAATVVIARPHAALLESGGLSRKDRGRCDRAFL